LGDGLKLSLSPSLFQEWEVDEGKIRGRKYIYKKKQRQEKEGKPSNNPET